MRLGLLGPANGDVGALGRGAEFLLNGVRVHRAIYLGNDGALDRAVGAWARKLVMPREDPSDEGAWRRAADLALDGTPADIDRFVTVERARLRLKALEALPRSTEPSASHDPTGRASSESRTIEMVGEHIAILIHDKSQLDEEDILGANLLFYGKSDGPLVRKIGPRWFATPGPIGSPGGGVAVLDDEQDEVVMTIYDPAGKPSHRETLTTARRGGQGGHDGAKTGAAGGEE